MVRDHFMYWLVEETLSNLATGGIAQYLYDFYRRSNSIKLEESNEPKVLNVDDLSYGFVMWFISCGIASSAFLFELTSIFIKKCFNFLKIKIRECIGLLFIMLWINGDMKN